MTGITVTRSNGNLLACKTAQPEDSDRLRHEAQLLKRLQHPGVVQFVDFSEGPPVELYLAFVGPDSWATQPPSTPSESIEALASAASTVADLHHLGTVHGALCPEHVLVAPDKRPVLCGLADATASTEAGCARDLAGLAGLIDHLAAVCEEKERRQLDALARRAERGSVTASDLTAELDRLHGDPYKLTRRPRRAQTPKPAKRTIALSAGVVALAVLGWIVLKPAGTNDSTPELSAAPLSESTQAANEPPTSPTTTVSTAGANTSSLETNSAISSATDDQHLIISHQGRRYGVGQPGDVAILGDWTCNGDPTLALLQPRTGVIAMFASWPAPSERIEADYVTVVEGATDLRNDPNGNCDHLRVTHPNGSTLIDAEFP